MPPPISTEPLPLHACDRLAASPYDPDRVDDGVAFDELNAPQAIAACRAAISEYPGVPRFEFQLGRAYHVEGQYAEALRWYRKAAAMEIAVAEHNIGAMYREGLGVEQDFTAAAKWFRKAAEQGVALTQVVLGGMYMEGQGVSQNDTEAVKWLRKAAEQGMRMVRPALAGCTRMAEA